MARESTARRFSEVERKILDAAAIGETADFTKDAEEGGEKPVVSGKFLSQLWLGMIEGANIHPQGIDLKGLRVEGKIELGGAQQSMDGRQPLWGFAAVECHFDDLLDFTNAECEGLAFIDCVLKGGETLSGETASLGCLGTVIHGGLYMRGCTCEGLVSVNMATIASTLEISGCRISAGFYAWGAKVGGDVNMEGCEISAGSGVEIVANFGNVQSSGQIWFDRNVIHGGFYLTDLECRELLVQRSRIGVSPSGVSINFSQAQVRGGVEFFRVNCAGRVLGATVSAQGEMNFSHCRFATGLVLFSSAVGGGLRLILLSVPGRHAEETGVDLSKVTAGTVEIHRSRLVTGLTLDGVQTGADLRIDSSRIGEARGLEGDSGEGLARDILSGLFMQTTGALSIVDTQVLSPARFQGCRLSGGLYFYKSFFAGREGDWSIQLSGSDIGGISCLFESGFANGLSMPTLACREIQIEGCHIAPGRQDGREDYAIWASDMAIERRLNFGRSQRAEGGLDTHVLGKIDFSNAQIGERFFLRSLRVAPASPEAAARDSTLVDLRRMRVTGDLMLAPRQYVLLEADGASEGPAFVEGCIAVDGASVGGDLVVHETEIRAVGEIKRPLSHFDSEERVSKRKRGVALSLRGAKIEGELEIGRPRLSGLVDMRDASVGLIADGGGERWEAAGIKRGHLMVDGLTYRDLDDVFDRDDGALGMVQSSGAASRRLVWLDLQYPGGKPTPDLFVPQPYEQLASIFAAEGNERARRQILVAKRDLQRRYGRLGRFERAIGWLLKVTSDYGYSPLRASLALLAHFAIGALIAWGIDMAGAFALANTDSSGFAPFNPILFAVDSALPIVDLDQDAIFTINAAALPRPFASEALVALGKGAYELIGLILVSITILTFTGTLREKE